MNNFMCIKSMNRFVITLRRMNKSKSHLMPEFIKTDNPVVINGLVASTADPEVKNVKHKEIFFREKNPRKNAEKQGSFTNINLISLLGTVRHID